MADISNDKPNIIYIMLDEVGYFEPSYMGNTKLKTPNIDTIAEEGVIFTNAYAGASLCAPTRVSLMTGKHMGHASMRSNSGGMPIRADEETVASMLKNAGYATGGFGKWGCGNRGTSGVPEDHGFDIFFGYYDQVHAHSFYPEYLVRNSIEVPLSGNTGVFYKGETHAQEEIFRELFSAGGNLHCGGHVADHLSLIGDGERKDHGKRMMAFVTLPCFTWRTPRSVKYSDC